MGEDTGGGRKFWREGARRGAASLTLAAATLLASGSEAAAAGKCTGGINERALCLVAKVSDTAVHVAWGARGIAIVFAGISGFENSTRGTSDTRAIGASVVIGSNVICNRNWLMT